MENDQLFIFERRRLRRRLRRRAAGAMSNAGFRTVRIDAVLCKEK
jgi:hypothetical protein